MSTDHEFEIKRKTPAEAVEALRTSISQFHDLVDHGIAQWAYEDSSAKNRLQLALGNRGSTERLLCSNRVVRQQAGEILIRHITRSQRKHGKSRTWYFLSFVDDRVLMNSYRPEVDLHAFKRRVDALVRSSGLHAVCAMEVQALNNYPAGGRGRTLMLNAHAIGYSEQPFDPKAAESRLRKSRRLQHDWGIPTVHIRQIGLDGSPIAWLAYYLLKAPHIGKYRKWDATARPPGYRLFDTAMRPDLAVRLAEFLTQVTFNEMVWGVRGGVAVVKAWRDELTAWAVRYKPSPARLHADADLAELWQETRALNCSPRLEPFRFLDRGDAPYEIAAEDDFDREQPLRFKSALERLPGYKPSPSELDEL